MRMRIRRRSGAPRVTVGAAQLLILLIKSRRSYGFRRINYAVEGRCLVTNTSLEFRKSAVAEFKLISHRCANVFRTHAGILTPCRNEWAKQFRK